MVELDRINEYHIKKKKNPRVENTYSSDSHAELTHRMKSGGTSVDDLFDELRDGSTSSPLLGEFSDLFLCGNFTSNKEPEKSFWKRLRASWCLGKLSLTFRNRLATESNTLL
jgi:hypothetical protein